MEIKLGDISPLAGLITKEGAFGKLADSGALGIAGKFVSKHLNDDKSADAAKEAALKEAALKDAANKEMAALASQYRPRQVESTGGAEGYKSFKKGGKISSASKRADGCAIKGKTKGRMI
jgi:hypothetical protein